MTSGSWSTIASGSQAAASWGSARAGEGAEVASAAARASATTASASATTAACTSGSGSSRSWTGGRSWTSSGSGSHAAASCGSARCRRRRDRGFDGREVDRVGGELDERDGLFEQGLDRREPVRVGDGQPRGGVVRLRACRRRTDLAGDVRGQRRARATQMQPRGRCTARGTVRLLGDRVRPLTSWGSCHVASRALPPACGDEVATVVNPTPRGNDRRRRAGSGQVSGGARRPRWRSAG